MIRTKFMSRYPSRAQLPPPTRPVPPISEKSTDNAEDNEYQGEEEHMTGPDEIRVEPKLTRTQLLLLDYRQFKAAQTIQAAARGWYTRRMFKRKRAAATKIQANWRAFLGRRRFYELLEKVLEERIEAHFYRCAQMIQALWRGYWIRKTVHDQYRLKRMQMRAAKDLLECIAVKMHHLIRTRQIPGIYSLRNSNCLSRVEKLLASMSYKQFNNSAYLIVHQKEVRLHDGRKTFNESAYGTRLPYEGLYKGGMQDPKCQEFLRESDADQKMFRILAAYEKYGNVDPQLANMQKKRRSNKHRESKVPKADFCKDIIESMRKWSILATNNVAIDSNIFDNIHNVEKFLCEAQSLYSIMLGRCGCQVNVSNLAKAAAESPVKAMPKNTSTQGKAKGKRKVSAKVPAPLPPPFEPDVQDLCAGLSQE